MYRTMQLSAVTKHGKVWLGVVSTFISLFHFVSLFPFWVFIAIVAKHVTDILYLVWFKNFYCTIGFY